MMRRLLDRWFPVQWWIVAVTPPFVVDLRLPCMVEAWGPFDTEDEATSAMNNMEQHQL